jgi:hypothetical protein
MVLVFLAAVLASNSSILYQLGCEVKQHVVKGKTLLTINAI